jgi:hypothetical protein
VADYIVLPFQARDFNPGIVFVHSLEKMHNPLERDGQSSPPPGITPGWALGCLFPFQPF